MTSRLTLDEARCARLKFRRGTRMEHFEVYWVPSIRGIIMRSIGATRVFRLPEGTVSVGIYERPFTPEDFIQDLEAMLVKMETAEATQRAHDQALIAATAL